MEKTQPVMVKSCILTMRPLSTFEQMYRFVPSQKVCFLTIDIPADPNLIVLGCIWNILRYKYNVYQMPTSGVQHTIWIGSEKVVLGLHFDWNLYLQVWAVDSYTEVFHTGETSVLPIYNAADTPEAQKPSWHRGIAIRKVFARNPWNCTGKFPDRLEICRIVKMVQKVSG